MATTRTRADAFAHVSSARARRTFLRHFPDGFRDETYLGWERDYKLAAHREWQRALGRDEMRALLADGKHQELAMRALRVEQRARHPMLFSFEKMALRDAVRTEAGARTFATGLDALLHGTGPLGARFEAWVAALDTLPRRGTRVVTWPVATVFAFLAQPRRHLFVKPATMRRAAAAYGWSIPYRSRPNWETYEAFLELARAVRRDHADLGARDMVDAQSFLWVLGSDEYA